jgi:hypothetical protein
MADVNGVEETFPDGLDFGVDPLTNPVEETFDDLAPHGLLLFNISPTPGGGLVRVNPKLIRTVP